MARRYSRDNRGRFASGGSSSGGGGKVGATARGGRLKTASGNKRATQTTKAAAAKPSGSIAGKVKRNPAAAGKIGQQAKAAAPKAVKRKAIGAISEAKAGRIISRMDANRPGLRKALSSSRKTTNAVNTFLKARDFALAAGRRARKQGKNLSVNESLQRGVKNAAAKSRKSPKAAAPAAAPKVAKPTSTKGARLGGTRRTTQAAAPQNTTANRTGQSKTLNRFNSRPVGTLVAGKGDNLVPSTKRVPLQVQRKESDVAFARVATKAARQRAAAPAKAAVRRTEANRTARALANQKRTVQTVLAKGGKRFSPTRKQKKSLAIADAASSFYSAKRVNSLPNFRVNTSKPGFRLPRNMR